MVVSGTGCRVNALFGEGLTVADWWSWPRARALAPICAGPPADGALRRVQRRVVSSSPLRCAGPGRDQVDRAGDGVLACHRFVDTFGKDLQFWLSASRKAP